MSFILGDPDMHEGAGGLGQGISADQGLERLGVWVLGFWARVRV